MNAPGIAVPGVLAHETEFSRAFPAHLRCEENSMPADLHPDPAGSTGSPQRLSRFPRRKARNRHHGAHSRDRRFDRSGSRCGIRHYLKQHI